MRLHVQLGRVDVAELDLLHAQLLAQLLRVTLGERRTLDDEPPQRLAELQPRGRTGLMAEPDDAAQLGDLVEQRRRRRRGLRPAGEVHRCRRVALGVAYEALPEMLGEERHHRRDDAQPLHERVARAPAARARRRPRSGGVSGGCTSWRGRRRTPRSARTTFTRQIRLVAGRRLGARAALVRASEPAVERPHSPGRQRAPVGRKSSIRPVVDQERAEFQSVSSLRWISLARAEAEQQVAVGRLRAELPAHHVGAHARERVRSIDRVPPRAVHLAARLVEHLLVAEHLVRRTPRQHDRHEVLGVEPEPDLLAHLRDPVGREPLLPVGMVVQVGGRQALAAPVA